MNAGPAAASSGVLTGRSRSTAASRRLLFVAAPAAAVALSLVVGAILIAAVGENPLEIYGLMLGETLGTGYGIGQTLFKATPLIFTGLAVAVGFRAGLFNIGVEGQLYLGAFAAAMVGATWTLLPPSLLLPLALAAAAAAGALWGAIPGVLKARFGSHEVINTIMLNFVAFALVSYAGRSVFEHATVRTAEIAPGAVLPRLDVWIPVLRGAPANLSLLLGLAAAVSVGLLLFRTALGYELRATGLNPPAAAYAGIRPGRTQVIAMALSGALAGLGGVNFVLGYKHFFEQGFSAGVGFIGIAVALVGRNHPIGVILAALFFGALGTGGLAVGQRVPRELIDVLQGSVILLAIVAQQVVERMLRRMA